MSAHRTAALLVAAAFALGSGAARPEGPAPSANSGAIPFDVTADKLWYDGNSGDWILDGHVVVERSGGILRAPRARFLHDAQALYLEGPVLAVQGAQVALADSARIDLAAHAADLDAAVLYVKQLATPALRALEDPKAARTLGKNAATLHAERAVKQDDGNTVLGDVTVTPCDCVGRPDYEIISPEVVVEGDRAWLARPHIRFLGLSIPFLPMALPLEDRQSGMLAPQLGYTSSTGFRFALPLYFTLGRSWDLTLTPGVFSGSFGSDHGADLASRDVRGPRLGADLRWAPIEGTRGELNLDLLQDFAASNSLAEDPSAVLPPQSTATPLFPGEHPTAAGRGLGGLRGMLHLDDRSDLAGWTLTAQLQLASDAMFLADTQPLTMIDRYLDDLRSDFGMVREFGPLALGFAATYLQDLRGQPFAEQHPTGLPLTPLFLQPAPANWLSFDRRLFGAEARATPTRLPSPFLQLLPEALGPFAFSSEASAAYVTTFVPSAEEKATGFAPTDLGASTAAQSPVAGADLARAPTLRFDFAPKLSAALPDGLPLRGRLFAGARADAWLFDGHPERDTRRLYGLAGAEASVLFERPFGSLLHSVEPQLFARAISPSLLGGGAPIGDPADAGGLVYAAAPLAAQQGVPPGTPPPPGSTSTQAALGVPALRRALDEVDGAAPSTGEVESSFALRQSLWSRPNPRAPPTRIASLVLQQDLLLWDHQGPARAADSAASASLWLPFFTLNGEARWDWHLRLFSLAQAGASLHDARTDDLHFSATALRGAAGDHIRAGIDELFAGTLLDADPGQVTGTLGAGASWALPAWALPVEAKGTHLGYDLIFHPGTLQPGIPDTVHTISFNWSPPCGCAALMLGVDIPFRDGSLLYAPSVRFNFQLQSLGR